MKCSLGMISQAYGNRTVLGASAAPEPLAKQLLQDQSWSSYGNKDYTGMPSVGYCLLILEPVV